MKPSVYWWLRPGPGAFRCYLWSVVVWLAGAGVGYAAEASKPSLQQRRPEILFLVGDEEYKTGETVPAWARQEVAPRGIECTFVIDHPKQPATLEGLDKLPKADALFVSLKRRALTREQFALIRRHIDAGKPVLGIRTASHAFGALKPEPGREAWETFDRDVFGGHYENHYGKGPPTLATIAAGAASHPLTTGLPTNTMTFISHLYKCRNLAPTSFVLLEGRLPEKPDILEPVAWVNTNANRRIFYTSLGSPEDFKEPAFRRLLLNATLWSVGHPFTQVEEGPAPKPSSGHKISDRSTPLPPEAAAKTFTVPEDLEMEQVLAEPIVRQPVFLNFDDRGRMWVVQYLQYPSPAGLQVVSKDQFWRAIYDKVPEPPPHGERGLDRITIHEDTNGDGIFDRHKTFLDGLNIATACVKVRGGVWVLNPPYLLFYPDQDDDDVPDGPPVVHLKGFGLEDTHSVVNSLRWGPDGWLYAAQGSTVTAHVQVMAPNEEPVPASLPGTPNGAVSSPARAAIFGSPPVYSQGQCIWRYHPRKHIYEIFAEGGGNAFGVEFDDKGRVFSGHNGGDTRGFHYVQGAYLQKGFAKHGELSNPHAFGYFPQMSGTKGERFTHTFIIYHGGALPPRYEGKLFGVEPLQGRVVLSEMTPDGSTFKTRDLERVVTSSDSWFRPVDIKAGPDGAIYIADWYDRQVTHTRNQEGNIDTSNGRIYRLRKKGARPGSSIDFAKLASSAHDVHPLLRHSNLWVRQWAQRVLTERPEAIRATALQPPTATRTHAPTSGRIEDFWVACAQDRFDESTASSLLSNPNTDIHARCWAIRLLGDRWNVSAPVAAQLQALASTETNVEVRAQLACSARRLPAADALPIVGRLLRHDEDATDPRLPLLCWWAIESKCDSAADAVLKLFEDSTLWTRPVVEQEILGRLMRRFAATGTRRDLLRCAELLRLAPDPKHSRILMRGFEEACKGRSVSGLPDELVTAMARHGVGSDAFKMRAGDGGVLTRALEVITDPKADQRQRQEFIDVLGETHPARALEALLRVAETEREPVLRKAAVNALRSYDDARIPELLVRNYGSSDAATRASVEAVLATRAGWSLALAEAVAEGKLKPADLPLETVRQMRRHKSEPLNKLMAKLWPNTGLATTEAMQKQIEHLRTVLRNGKGDPYSGQKLFQANCASCHTLFARGGQVGPDLTSYQRGDLEAMLVHIVNPNAEIREGYESFGIELKDERSLTGFLVERDGKVVVLRGLDGQNVVIDRNEIVEMKNTGMSLMPEGLLEQMQDQQLRDLFAYLRSTQPLAN